MLVFSGGNVCEDLASKSEPNQRDCKEDGQSPSPPSQEGGRNKLLLGLIVVAGGILVC